MLFVNDCGALANVFINLFAELSGAPAIVGTAELSGASVTDSSALCMILHGHELPITSALDVVVIGSVKVDENFLSLLYYYPFHYDEESEISSTLGNMRTYGNYAWDTKVMISQSSVHHSGKDVSMPANVERKVTEMAK